MRLLLLGTLRYIGRACTFDDLEEATCLSRELHQNFYHAFIEYMSTVLFSKYVTPCITHESAAILE